MSCKNCDCLDCRTERAVDRIKNRANETEDDYMPPVLAAAPIHRPTWQDAEPANEEQAKAWTECANAVIEEYGGKPINLSAFVYLTVSRIRGLKRENTERVALQVERFLRESPSFQIRKGRDGGVFKAIAKKEAEPLKYISLTELKGVPDLITGQAKDDHTCKCGNTKCSKTEKSCWKCGEPIT